MNNAKGMPKFQTQNSPVLIVNCGLVDHYCGISLKSNSDITKLFKFVSTQLQTFGRHDQVLLIPEVTPLFCMQQALPVMVLSSEDLDVNEPMMLGVEGFENTKDYVVASLRVDYERVAAIANVVCPGAELRLPTEKAKIKIRVAQGNIDGELLRRLNQFNNRQKSLQFSCRVYPRELAYIGLKPSRIEMLLTVLSPHALFVRSNRRNLLKELVRDSRVTSLIAELLTQVMVTDSTIQHARRRRGVLPCREDAVDEDEEDDDDEEVPLTVSRVHALTEEETKFLVEHGLHNEQLMKDSLLTAEDLTADPFTEEDSRAKKQGQGPKTAGAMRNGVLDVVNSSTGVVGDRYVRTHPQRVRTSPGPVRGRTNGAGTDPVRGQTSGTDGGQVETITPRLIKTSRQLSKTFGGLSTVAVAGHQQRNLGAISRHPDRSGSLGPRESTAADQSQSPVTSFDNAGPKDQRLKKHRIAFADAGSELADEEVKQLTSLTGQKPGMDHKELLGSLNVMLKSPDTRDQLFSFLGPYRQKVPDQSVYGTPMTKDESNLGDGDKTLTSDLNGTVVEKKFQQSLTSAFEGLDPRLDPDEEEIPEGSDDGLNDVDDKKVDVNKSTENEPDIFNYQVREAPPGMVVPQLKYRHGNFFWLWPMNHFEEGVARVSFTTSDPELLWFIIHQLVALPKPILMNKPMSGWPDSLQGMTLSRLMSGPDGGYRYYTYMRRLNDEERTLDKSVLDGHDEDWEKIPISFWKSSQDHKWEITRNSDEDQEDIWGFTSRNKSKDGIKEPIYDLPGEGDRETELETSKKENPPRLRAPMSALNDTVRPPGTSPRITKSMSRTSPVQSRAMTQSPLNTLAATIADKDLENLKAWGEGNEKKD